MSTTITDDTPLSGTTDLEYVDRSDHDHGTPHWVNRMAFPIVSALFFATQAAIILGVYYSNYWIVVPLSLLASHFMHGQLIAFHEASHGSLRKNRTLNNLDGLIIGLISFTSFTLYRAAHQTHHVHICSERDEEFWPFVRKDVSRTGRILFAIAELTFGLYMTPFVFFRVFIRKNSAIRAPRVRRKIWNEYILMGVFWGTVVGTVAWFGLWKYFLWVYLIPGWIGGNLQAWRKYIEHVGMTGTTANGLTRSIVDDTWTGKLVSLTLLHEPFHGVHHQVAGIPHAEMPLHREVLHPKAEGDVPPFPSYTAAFFHLFKCLRDPKVGPHWNQPTNSV